MQLFGCLNCDLQNIGENPFNPRQLGDDDEQRRLATLQESIEKYGLFDAPLLARVEGLKGLIPISGGWTIMRDIYRWTLDERDVEKWVKKYLSGKIHNQQALERALRTHYGSTGV